jgi:AsmA protein
MRVMTLVFDTQVTTRFGTGSIDLGDETLNLTFSPKTKNTSPVALLIPIYVRGSFAQPTVNFDKTRVAVRAAGAVALGLTNPLLALLLLIDAGPGTDSDCASLLANSPTN